MSTRRFGLAIKRSADLVVSATLLVLSAPLMLICAAIIKLDSKGPALFRQERLGQNGKLFRVCKFRTMARDVDAKGIVIADGDPRVTRVGRVFRKFRMDEW